MPLARRYRALYREVDAEDQMAITIRSDNGVILAFAFNRSRRDFTESDRVKLNLVRPHLLQAYANAEELAGHLEEKDDLQTALRETGHGLVAGGNGGQAVHATLGATECLQCYIHGRHVDAGDPAAVVDWLDRDRTAPFVVGSSDSPLIVRRPRILGVAHGTVKQHVEHALDELGVENSTAAAALARERGLLQ